MISLGFELQRAREERGISLREISERTQIRLSVLRAIESEDFQRLPGGVITRGYLKLYARELGLDAADIGRRYEERVQLHEAVRADRAGTVADTSWFAALREPEARLPLALYAGAFVLLALTTIGYLVFRPGPAGQPGPEAPGARAEAVGDAAMPAEDGDNEGAQPTRAPAGSTNVLQIDVVATGDCWLAATSDGAQVAYRVINAGERLAFRTTDEAVLRIGVPDNLRVSINSRSIRPFERRNTPVTLRITPGNYRELLAP